MELMGDEDLKSNVFVSRRHGTLHLSELVGPSVTFFESLAIFALLPLPNCPQLGYGCMGAHAY